MINPYSFSKLSTSGHREIARFSVVSKLFMVTLSHSLILPRCLFLLSITQTHLLWRTHTHVRVVGHAHIDSGLQQDWKSDQCRLSWLLLFFFCKGGSDWLMRRATCWCCTFALCLLLLTGSIAGVAHHACHSSGNFSSLWYTNTITHIHTHPHTHTHTHTHTHISRFFNSSPALSSYANAPGFRVWFALPEIQTVLSFSLWSYQSLLQICHSTLTRGRR